MYLHRDDRTAVLSEPVRNDPGAKSYWGVSHGCQIRDFYEHVLERRPYPLNGPEGYKALRLVTDIYESSRSGQRIHYQHKL